MNLEKKFESFLSKHKALEPLKPLLDQGEQLYLVGGAIRNFILEAPIKDFDFCTPLSAKQVEQFCQEASQSQRASKLGSFSFKAMDFNYNLTVLRKEGPYSDKRRPDWVETINEPQQDSLRRDFTINAIYWDCLNSQFLDFHQGLKHLESKTLCMIGPPLERLAEDPLRLLRAVRFCHKYELKMEASLLDAAFKIGPLLQHVPERLIFKELESLWDQPIDQQHWELFLNLGPWIFQEAKNLNLSYGAVSLKDWLKGLFPRLSAEQLLSRLQKYEMPSRTKKQLITAW